MEEKCITIIIPQEPVAKKRPRFARRGQYVKIYDLQEVEKRQYAATLAVQFQNPVIPQGTPVRT